MKYCLKHISSLILAIMMTVVLVLPVSARAVSIDLLPYAKARLTEVLGFTGDEASEFIFGEQKDDSEADAGVEHRLRGHLEAEGHVRPHDGA